MSRDAEQSPLPGELPLKEAIDWSQSRAPALALDLARQLAELMQRLSQQRVSLAMELADLRVSQGRLYFDTRGRSALAGLDAELHYLTSFRRLMSALLEPLSRCSQAPLLWILTRRYGSLAELLEALEQARVAGPASESQLSCEALSDFAIPEPPSAPSLLALLRLPPRLALGLTALAMLSSAIAAWWLLRPTGLPEHCLVLRGDGEILVLDTQSERSLSRWPLDNRVIAISWSQHPWVAVVEPDGLAVELLDGRTGKAAGRLRLPTSGSPVTHIVGLSEGLVAVAPAQP